MRLCDYCPGQHPSERHGTHLGGPRTGRVTSKPEKQPGGPIRRARKRLAARQEAFDRLSNDRGYIRPGSIKVR